MNREQRLEKFVIWWRQLLALNETVAGRIAAGQSVAAPGAPADYPNPSERVSQGCITPPELL